MITRLYADNFKCLANFEVKLDPFTALIGPNGSGKSSILDVLDGLRRLVSGEASAIQAFPTRSLARWQTGRVQQLEVDASLMGHELRFTIHVEHDVELARCRVIREELSAEGQPLFTSAGGNAQLFRDGGSKGPSFPIDWSRSGISMINPSKDNKLLTAFRAHMARVLVVTLDPWSMSGISTAIGTR